MDLFYFGFTFHNKIFFFNFSNFCCCKEIKCINLIMQWNQAFRYNKSINLQNIYYFTILQDVILHFSIALQYFLLFSCFLLRREVVWVCHWNSKSLQYIFLTIQMPSARLNSESTRYMHTIISISVLYCHLCKTLARHDHHHIIKNH